MWGSYAYRYKSYLPSQGLANNIGMGATERVPKICETRDIYLATTVAGRKRFKYEPQVRCLTYTRSYI